MLQLLLLELLSFLSELFFLLLLQLFHLSFLLCQLLLLLKLLQLFLFLLVFQFLLLSLLLKLQLFLLVPKLQLQLLLLVALELLRVFGCKTLVLLTQLAKVCFELRLLARQDYSVDVLQDWTALVEHESSVLRFEVQLWRQIMLGKDQLPAPQSFGSCVCVDVGCLRLEAVGLAHGRSHQKLCGVQLLEKREGALGEGKRGEGLF